VREARATVIAVASGKGGTGKTTVAAHLALAASRRGKALLVDLDVEAPDELGYFRDAAPSGERLRVELRVPRLDASLCTGCRLCAKICRFGAIVALGKVVTVNDRICKGCGRCVAACPAGALGEVEAEVGGTARFKAGELAIIEGRMTVGDIRSTAVIEAAKRRAAAESVDTQIRDCPPGVTCPSAHAIEGADCLVLVAEPTRFSLHDLGAALELAKGRGIPVGVVLNKEGFGGADVEGFCGERGVPIMGRIAFSRERASSGAAACLWGDDRAFMAEVERILARAAGVAAPGAGSEAAT